MRRWNRDRWVELGFTDLVTDLFIDAGVSYHDATRLLARGASKNEVLRILL